MLFRKGDERITPSDCLKEGSVVRKHEPEASFRRLKTTAIENAKPQQWEGRDPSLLHFTPSIVQATNLLLDRQAESIQKQALGLDPTEDHPPNQMPTYKIDKNKKH